MTIRNVGGSKPWCLFSKKGKKLGCYKTKKEAENREREVNYFKHKGK